MQKVRGSNPLSSTDLLDFCSIFKTLTGLGFFVALAFVVVEESLEV
jgi:hypothetical protein